MDLEKIKPITFLPGRHAVVVAAWSSLVLFDVGVDQRRVEGVERRHALGSADDHGLIAFGDHRNARFARLVEGAQCPFERIGGRQPGL